MLTVNPITGRLPIDDSDDQLPPCRSCQHEGECTGCEFREMSFAEYQRYCDAERDYPGVTGRNEERIALRFNYHHT